MHAKSVFGATARGIFSTHKHTVYNTQSASQSTFGASGREDGASIGNFGTFQKFFWIDSEKILDRSKIFCRTFNFFLSNVPK